MNYLKSAVGFFNVGEREAIFRASGIKPVVNDKLTILVIVGRSTGKQSLSSDAGRESRQQGLLKGLYISKFLDVFLTDIMKVI